MNLIGITIHYTHTKYHGLFQTQEKKRRFSQMIQPSILTLISLAIPYKSE